MSIARGDSRQIPKIDLSKVFFAFSIIAFGVSLASILVGAFVPGLNIFMAPGELNKGTQLLSGDYIWNSPQAWLITVSIFVFLVFPAIGVIFAVLGFRAYKRMHPSIICPNDGVLPNPTPTSQADGEPEPDKNDNMACEPGVEYSE
ncbi:MAG TPA: hypothetical protein VKM55_12365 [Candidatus Lokiarchaeia archaeon]|nr:hypothetical protein [Candidatus Lokiarchaeia archaeon]